MGQLKCIASVGMIFIVKKFSHPRRLCWCNYACLIYAIAKLQLAELRFRDLQNVSIFLKIYPRPLSVGSSEVGIGTDIRACNSL